MNSTALTTQPAASGFALAMSPQTIADAREFCNMLAKTEFVPKAFRSKPDSIMVVGAMGARLGVDVFTAMSGIADINGKPCVYGDLMMAVCQNHPAFIDCVEAFEGTPYEKEFRAVCVVTRKGREPVVRSFSVVEAIEGLLWKKSGPWTTAPQRMLQMRARAFALRDAFSDALAGFHSREEMEDAIDVQSERVPNIPDAKDAKVRQISTSSPAAVDQVTTANSSAETVTDPAAGEEPVVVTGLEITAASVTALAQGIAKEFKGTGISGIKAINAKLGVKSIAEVPADKLEQAHTELIALQRDLNENA
jgi:hypothetical protein